MVDMFDGDGRERETNIKWSLVMVGKSRGMY